MKKYVTLRFILAIFIITSNSNAALQIDINQGKADPIPISINFAERENSNSKIANKLYQVITNDLESSGIFKVIPKEALLDFDKLDNSPSFRQLKALKATSFILIDIEDQTKILKVKVEMWDPYTEKLLSSISYEANYKDWRRIAHKIADYVYSNLTGESGMFDSRILYIAESGKHNRRIKRLAIMDQDGANQTFLTDGQDLCLTPRFDMNSHRAIYMSYKGKVPQVYILDIATGEQYLIGKFPGMSFAPRFSPDGEKAIMSIAKRGSTNIALLDLNTQNLSYLTKDIGIINTSPSFSPDGGKIVFNSDRGGKQQLYIMNKDGSEIHRISYGTGSYATPVWSPRGDFIAFTKMHQGQFYIGIMRADGTNEKLLASNWLVEGPTWSPNGRNIMFYKQIGVGKKAKNVLCTVDITGNHQKQIETKTDASDPAWSPILP